MEKKKIIHGMLIGRSKAPKARKKHRRNLAHMNKTPYHTPPQKEKHKDVKRRIRESKAKHREMYGK